MIYKHFISKISKFCVIYFLIFISQNCSKDSVPYVPDVPVYYELNLNSELANLGESGFVTVTPDSLYANYSIVSYHNNKFLPYSIPWKTYGNGIIIYRKSVSEYQAFDITCTYRGIEDHCALNLKAGDLVATCPCCGSEYILSADGYPATKSIAKRPLWKYNTSIVGNGINLVVYK
jgi:hypothetical protein